MTNNSFVAKVTFNKWIAINKLPIASNPILMLLGHCISVDTTGFLLDDVILLESINLHSGSNKNCIHTGIIDSYTNFVSANNSTKNKLYFCPV